MGIAMTKQTLLIVALMEETVVDAYLQITAQTALALGAPLGMMF